MLLQPRGDQADRLLRAIDDVALGELDEAAREGETPEGEEAQRPGRAGPGGVAGRRCGRPGARRRGG